MTEPSSEPSPEPTSELSGTAGETHPLHRRLKSFVKRGGRTTDGQAKAYADFGPKWLVPYRSEVLDLEAAFGRAAPTVLEIGFGMGEATAHIARLLPQTNFLCCEVHEAGVGKLLKRCGEEGIGNIRIVAHDAVDVLDAMVLPGTLAGIHVFFPDPWHKKRHHKRRLIQPEFVAKLADRLQPGGYLHCATDWEPYAQQMLEVLRGTASLRNTADVPSGFAPKPGYRPLTKFEARGLALGHGVWDLLFERNTHAAEIQANPGDHCVGGERCHEFP
ncbi:MAG: tRNA (guanosine(46)-N7)-methyltransferase TrmB [Comamonadaceae bacterium]|nr:MAG: tRNA (guanosine(46)-N7)-methyltransferase TrmB [Comamonadaceae bacterium]